MIRKDEKRQRILNAAVALFSRSHDVKKVSVEDIAAEARVSPTTIYNYFGTREVLVIDTAKVLMREILKMGFGILRSDLPFPQKLQAIIAGKTDLIGQYSREVLGKLLGNDKSTAVYGRELYESEVKPLWREFIASGKKEGYIDPSIDDEALIAYLDLLRAGIAGKPELAVNYEQNMELLQEMSRLMFYGFLKKDIELFPPNNAIQSKGEQS
jgi:AcrR family transcriptional regulator